MRNTLNRQNREPFGNMKEHNHPTKPHKGVHSQRVQEPDTEWCLILIKHSIVLMKVKASSQSSKVVSRAVKSVSLECTHWTYSMLRLKAQITEPEEWKVNSTSSDFISATLRESTRLQSERTDEQYWVHIKLHWILLLCKLARDYSCCKIEVIYHRTKRQARPTYPNIEQSST